jgi:hypothetical protein
MKSLKTLSLALALAATAIGAAHAATPNGRVIEVSAQTRYINVTQGETVTLKVGDQLVPVHVDTYPNVNSVALSRIAPDAPVAQPVTVYIAPDMTYQAG